MTEGERVFGPGLPLFGRDERHKVINAEEFKDSAFHPDQDRLKKE